MEQNSKNGGLLPSAMALKDSLNQRPATSSEPMMLTPLQLELLRQSEAAIDSGFSFSRSHQRNRMTMLLDSWQ